MLVSHICPRTLTHTPAKTPHNVTRVHRTMIYAQPSPVRRPPLVHDAGSKLRKLCARLNGVSTAMALKPPQRGQQAPKCWEDGVESNKKKSRPVFAHRGT